MYFQVSPLVLESHSSISAMLDTDRNEAPMKASLRNKS